MAESDKPLVWLGGEVETPPFSMLARVEAGFLLRRVQRGESLAMPVARPMPGLGPRCYELRVRDQRQSWRIVLRADVDAVVIAEVFAKKTRETPSRVIEVYRDRFRRYDETARGRGDR